MKYVLTALFLCLPFSLAHAHCQIPCGIFDDARVFDELEEHITTIEKSMKSITASDNANAMMDLLLSKKNAPARKEWLEKKGSLVRL